MSLRVISTLHLPDRFINFGGGSADADSSDDLVVDPRGNRLTLNGRSVYTESLPRARYQVYFMPGAR